MYIDFATGLTLPPYWNNHPINVVRDYSSLKQSEASGNLYQCPLRLRLKGAPDDALWTLPFDPVISVRGGNKIVRSDVLKQDTHNTERRGSIKEVWSQDDYEIQIAGLFIGDDAEGMPQNDIEKLRNLCEAREVLYVECDLLDVFNIKYIAIEKYDFAHTPGRNNQQFSITAYSDDDFSLIVK